jgi:hypothetical protein
VRLRARHQGDLTDLFELAEGEITVVEAVTDCEFEYVAGAGGKQQRQGN